MGSMARSPSSPTWRSTPTGPRPAPPASRGSDTSYRAQMEYAGDRYGLTARSARGRRQLQSRGRLRAPRQHPREHRPGPLQPAAGIDQIGAQVLWHRDLHSHRRRRRAAADADGRRRVRDRAPEQRPVQRRHHQQLRAADAAVRHPAVGENSGRRVPVHGRAGGVHVRPAAAAVWHPQRRARRVLRWPSHQRHVQSHARQLVAALLARAERVDQLDRPARRVRSPRRSPDRA